MRSRRKGKVGEREAAAEIGRVLKVEARRGQQFQGGSDSPDVMVDIPGVWMEVKRREAFSLYGSLEKAVSDAGPDNVPVVLHRKNHKPWVVVVRLDDLPQLAVQLYLHLAANA